MRNSFIVAWFTIKETVRKKSFIISNVVILLLILLIFSLINMLFGNYSLKSNSNTSSNTVYASEASKTTNTSESTSTTTPLNILLIDTENLLGNKPFTLHDEKVSFVFSKDISNDDIYKKINQNEIYSAVRVYSSTETFGFDYIVINSSSENSEAVDYVSDLLNNCYLVNLLSKYNIDNSVISKIQSEPEYNIISPNGVSDIKSSYIVGMFVSFVLFFAIYLYGHSISASVASEKNTRVMETLVTSASPTQIVLGKTLGMGLLGLIQMLCIAIVTSLAYKTFIPPGIDIVSIYLPDVRFDAFSIFIIIIYFILGYTIYAFLNAVTGATVSKAEDIQSANLPLSFITMFSFYLSFFTFNSTNSKLSKIAAIFPFSSPFSMPSKVLAGFSNGYDIFASVIVLVLTTVILAFISIRLYSIAILHYGNRLKFKDLIKKIFTFK